ncbi:FadR/GntR family transcriptional regulator [Clostridium sp. Marseille-P2415]|uniref:FadR/GntR family transcriptional regulator n=1 Tax=Clostridium sp. Marseille-P2415 TaxID=1805471 RepID=UPI000988829B|nr:FadR/GntR family transcriptional regulator [Clostridium sp. Marseille-P2415]
MEEVSRIPIVQQVVNSMKEFVAADGIAVGQKLPTEKEWCEKLTVGRGTVREAFRILEARGLVEIKPGRGAFLVSKKELGQEELAEWFLKNEVELKDYIEVRSVLEPLCARFVAKRATDAELEQIERTHFRFIRAVEEEDFAGMAKYDEKLHRQIVEASRNKMLIFMNKKIDECIRDFRLKTFQVPQNARNAIKAHHNIVEALKARDEEVAELYAKRHISLINTDMNVIIKR